MAVVLDPRLVVAPSLEMYFVDKDTGAPLAGGFVFFYLDSNRTVPKTVYEISGPSGGPYTFIPLPNPITLSAVGTFADAGNNNILPYYFPYDGTPTSSMGTVQLYYIEVYNSDMVFQFSREAWPPDSWNGGGGGETTDVNIINYIPNPQFLINNYVSPPMNPGAVPGKITQTNTALAPGGWWFIRSPDSLAEDTITFPTFPTVPVPSDVPPGNTRYVLQYTETHAGNDALKLLICEFPNVATFQNSLTTFVLQFYANSLSGSVPGVEIVISYWFGTGGTPSSLMPVVQDIQTITPGWGLYSINVDFMDITSYRVGTNNDDYVSIGLNLPNAVCDIQFTNFALYANNMATIPAIIPNQTSYTQFDASTAGALTYTNSAADLNYNLYLPILLGLEGFIYDYSIIGNIENKTTANTYPYLLQCDGSSYEVDLYSSGGIPYARLGSILWNSTIQCYIFGTGVGNYQGVFPSITGTTNTLRIVQNTQGNVNPITQLGTLLTLTTPQPYMGKTYALTPTGGQVNYACTAAMISGATNVFNINGLAVNNTTNNYIINPGTMVSPFNGVKLDGSENLAQTPVAIPSVINDIYQVTLGAASTISDAQYFYFQVQNQTNPAAMVQNTVWYDKSGTAVQPTLLGTTFYIHVRIDPTDAAGDVAQKTCAAINNLDTQEITFPVYMTGNYDRYWFTIDGQGGSKLQYWYNTGGSITPPATVTGYTLVPIIIQNTFTPMQIIQATLGMYTASSSNYPFGTPTLGINTYFYQVPDLYGWSLRGWNGPMDQGVDTQSGSRFSSVWNYQGANIGSYQNDFVRQHFHQYNSYFLGNSTSGLIVSPTGVTPGDTTNWGVSENLVKNMYVNYTIRY